MPYIPSEKVTNLQISITDYVDKVRNLLDELQELTANIPDIDSAEDDVRSDLDTISEYLEDS